MANGVVYVGSSSDNGQVFALDASTGAELWSATIGPVDADPAVVNGWVYVGSYNQDKLYAFGLAD